MKWTSKLLLGTAAMAALLTFSGAASAMQTPSKAPPPAAKKAEAVPAPSAQEIADAKTKGLVWVNLGTGVYHKDGEFFGKTKRGKFLTEDEAKKAGYRAAKEPIAVKKKIAPKTDIKK